VSLDRDHALVMRGIAAEIHSRIGWEMLNDLGTLLNTAAPPGEQRTPLRLPSGCARSMGTV